MARADISFEVWGCRGSRGLPPGRSRIGNHTSCYALLDGERLFVLDAGSGLSLLGDATARAARFSRVREVHILVSHAHRDHWDGLKDADWFWRRDNGLHVHLWGPGEALSAIARGFEHPSFVPLALLGAGTVASLGETELLAGETRTIAGWSVRTFALYHGSGSEEGRRPLDTLGYTLERAGGPRVAYMLDHEPSSETQPLDDQVTGGAHLVVRDAHFARVSEQCFGHGSQEAAAQLARRHPGAVVLAAHHGPGFEDRALRASFRGFARGLPNLRLAIEGDRYVWDARRGAFREPPAPRRAESSA